MKRINLYLLILTLISVSCNTDKPSNAEEALSRLNEINKIYWQNFDNEQYRLCLENLDVMLELCHDYSLRDNIIIDLRDRELFMYQKLNQFRKGLKAAFRLEKIAAAAGDKSPWYYLKIADCYLGLNDYPNTVKWMQMAVDERDFENYTYLMRDQYSVLLTSEAYNSLITQMKDKIGLQHPAKDFKIATVEGGEIQLSSLKGKVVLIDFWDINCPPCLKAMPGLRELYEEYGDDGFEIIGISLDTDKEKLNAFLEEEKLPWQIACTYKGKQDETARLYGINATPSTWLVDRNGVLQYYNISGQNLREAIDSLIHK